MTYLNDKAHPHVAPLPAQVDARHLRSAERGDRGEDRPALFAHRREQEPARRRGAFVGLRAEGRSSGEAAQLVLARALPGAMDVTMPPRSFCMARRAVPLMLLRAARAVRDELATAPLAFGAELQPDLEPVKAAHWKPFTPISPHALAAAGHPRACVSRRGRSKTRAASGLKDFDLLLAEGRRPRAAPANGRHHGRGLTTAYAPRLRRTRAPAVRCNTVYVDGGVHITSAARRRKRHSQPGEAALQVLDPWTASG